MFVLKKIVKMGGSRVIALPPGWLDYIEQKQKASVEEVEVEIGEQLIIRPHTRSPN